MTEKEIFLFLIEKADFYENPNFIESDPIQIPHKFFQAVCPEECGFNVPEEGDYGAGFVYLAQDEATRREKLTGWEDYS